MSITTITKPTKAPKARRPYPGRPLKSATHDATTSPAERAQRAWLLRLGGHTWAQIAPLVGYHSGNSARAAGLRYALELCPPSEEERQRGRTILLAQLDALWTQVEPSLASPDTHLREVARSDAEKLLMRYGRLLGCAPSETPAAQRLARYGLAIQP